jgi:hypothetical protein
LASNPNKNRGYGTYFRGRDTKKMGLETDSYIPLIQRFRPTCIETYATDEANSS